MHHCDLCEDTGFQFVERAGIEVSVRCSCRHRERRAQRLAGATRERETLPRRFRDAVVGAPAVQGMHPYALSRVRTYAREVSARVAGGRGLWLYGPPGTGKSVTAAALANAAIDAGLIVAWSTPLPLLAAARGAWGGEPVAERRAERVIADPDLLVVDDLDIARADDWAVEIVANQLRRRATGRLPATVVTSAAHPSELGDTWGWKTIAALRDVTGAALCVDPAYVPSVDADVVITVRRAQRRKRAEAAA